METEKRRAYSCGEWIPIIVVFTLGEFYLREQGFRPYLRTFPGYHRSDPIAGLVSDPVLGWTSNTKGPEINQQGFRNASDFNKIDLNSGKRRIMILGDSFMWGAGVRMEENAPSLLQTKLGDSYECFNLGVPGWGIDQMYLSYQRYKDLIKPDVVILSFIDDDVNRVLEAFRNREHVSKPSFLLKNEKLIYRTSASKIELILNRFMQRSVFFSLFIREIYLMKEARPIVRQIFHNMVQETQQRNEKFVLVRIPMVWDNP